MMLCLAAGALTVSLGAGPVTLAWTHSVERVLWEEVWRAGAEGLVLERARVRGSGAGMEPPADAVLRDGAWEWRPALPPRPSVTLARSRFVADWRICADDRCRTLHEIIPPGADTVELRQCGEHPPASP